MPGSTSPALATAEARLDAPSGAPATLDRQASAVSRLGNIARHLLPSFLTSSSTEAPAASPQAAEALKQAQKQARDRAAKEFDYVIIGGGTAGSVLANRLTEDNRFSVALIEAGPSDVGDDRVLKLARWLEMIGSELDYDYTTVEQPRGNSNIHHSRAKVLGGCSSHNTLISFRPLKEDLDWWAQCHGCPSWSSAHLQPYGDRLKLNTVPVQPQHRNQVVRDWVAAAAAAYDLPVLSDFNAQIVHGDGFKPWKGKGAGFFSISYDPYNGDRSSASTAYLHPIMEHAGRSARNNLHLFTDTWAQRLLFSPTDKTRIEGVQVGPGSGTRAPSSSSYAIKARREVILCAGAIDTPRLLLLSGIGPRRELEALKVPVHHDLPGVGRNLSDHPETIIMWETKDTPTETVMQSDAGVFLRVLPPNEEPANGEIHQHQPDMMMHCYQVVFDLHLQGKGYKVPPHAFCMTPNIPRSQARGTITLKSSNPNDKPLIDFKYFEDERRYDERIVSPNANLPKRHLAMIADILGPLPRAAGRGNQGCAQDRRAGAVQVASPPRSRPRRRRSIRRGPFGLCEVGSPQRLPPRLFLQDGYSRPAPKGRRLRGPTGRAGRGRRLRRKVTQGRRARRSQAVRRKHLPRPALHQPYDHRLDGRRAYCRPHQARCLGLHFAPAAPPRHPGVNNICIGIARYRIRSTHRMFLFSPHSIGQIPA